MKRIFGIASGIALLAAGAAAQEVEKMKADLEKMLITSKLVAAGGGVMGRHIKGAPYSAQEVNESSQTLGDGTRIRNESRAMVYRDSEGRVRREVGDNVTIWDPVANVNYSIDTKNMRGVKSSMVPAEFQTFTRKLAAERATAGGVSAVPLSYRAVDGATSGTISVKDGIVTVTKDGKTQTFPVGPDGTWVSDDGKMRATVKQFEHGGTAVAGVAGARLEAVEVRDGQVTVTKDGHTTTGPVSGDVFTYANEGRVRMLAPENVGFATAAGGRGMFVAATENTGNVKSESLGDQVIEGVKSRGTRITSTIEAGKIGNDRPLNTLNERWYSDELQVEVMSKRSDPRSGDQTFRLVNINRAEPAAYLFQAPTGYTITERK